MNYIINASLQVLPSSDTKHPYSIVDEAIKIIQQSGLKYQVCPFETVLEGDYDTVMATIKKAQEACLLAGAKSMLSYIKVQISAERDIAIEDKTAKYQ